LIGQLLLGGPGGIAAYVAKQLGREVPDAIKLGLLKFLGTSGPVEAGAFKQMVHVAEQAYKAAQTTDKAIKGIFKQGVESSITAPSPARVERLSKMLDAAQVDPAQILEGQDTQYGQYLPEMAMASSTTLMRASQAMQEIAPKQEKQAPLDSVREPNPQQKAAQQRALQMLEQPTMILKHIKDGRLTPNDLFLFRDVYPNLYQQYSERIWEQIMEMADRGDKLPPSVAASMSLFLGQPLNSTLIPGNIMGNQAVVGGQQPMAQPQAVKPSQAGLKGLDKLSQSVATPAQQRSIHRSK
jgi:hypothetical protein